MQYGIFGKLVRLYYIDVIGKPPSIQNPQQSQGSNVIACLHCGDDDRVGDQGSSVMACLHCSDNVRVGDLRSSVMLSDL